MSHRIAKPLLCVGFLLLLSGCIEMTQTITLNPDGRGKIHYDVRMPGELQQGQPGGPAGGKEKSLEELKQAAVVRTLTKQRGLAAWKDVNAEWMPDGRLHFSGTAYFNRIEDLSEKGAMDFLAEQYELTRDKDDVLTLKIRKATKDGKDKGMKKPRPDFAKMSKAEMDEHVMRERVKYQSSKGILIAMFTDLKWKSVLKLPGEASEAKNFKKENERTVSREIDGNKVLASIHKMMSLDNAELQKKLQAAKNPELLEELLDLQGFQDATLTVHKLDAPQFDFDKEVKEARAAYPALRQRYNIGPKTKLPGEESREPAK